jgi:hypothetical protein
MNSTNKYLSQDFIANSLNTWLLLYNANDITNDGWFSCDNFGMTCWTQSKSFYFTLSTFDEDNKLSRAAIHNISQQKEDLLILIQSFVPSITMLCIQVKNGIPNCEYEDNGWIYTESEAYHELYYVS